MRQAEEGLRAWLRARGMAPVAAGPTGKSAATGVKAQPELEVGGGQFEGVLQRSHRIAQRDEFVTDVAGKAAGDDGAEDGRIIQFLVIVQFVAPRNAGGVIVTEPGMKVADGLDDVALP